MHTGSLRSQGSIKKPHTKKKTILLKLLTLQPKGLVIKVMCELCVLSVCERQTERQGEMRQDHRDLLHGRGILISIKTGPTHSSRELKTLIVLSAFLSLSLTVDSTSFLSHTSPPALLPAYEVGLRPRRLIVGDKWDVCNCLIDGTRTTEMV